MDFGNIILEMIKMKNINQKMYIATLIIGVIIVSIGIIGLNYGKISRMLENVVDKTQTVGENEDSDTRVGGKSDTKLSKDEKAVSKLVDQYMEAQMSCDAAAIFNMQPEEVIDAMEDYITWVFEDQDEYFCVMREEMENTWEGLQESLDGAAYTITYEISEFLDMTEAEIADYSLGYSIYTMLDEELNIEITEAKKVVVDLYMNCDGKTSESGSMTPTFIKVNGKWYLGMDQ